MNPVGNLSRRPWVRPVVDPYVRVILFAVVRQSRRYQSRIVSSLLIITMVLGHLGLLSQSFHRIVWESLRVFKGFSEFFPCSSIYLSPEKVNFLQCRHGTGDPIDSCEGCDLCNCRKHLHKLSQRVVQDDVYPRLIVVTARPQDYAAIGTNFNQLLHTTSPRVRSIVTEHPVVIVPRMP